MTAIYITLGFLFIGWYIVNFIRDMTRKDPEELLKKQEDEDIDISDEVRQFQPVLIEKEPKKTITHGNEQNAVDVSTDKAQSQMTVENEKIASVKSEKSPTSSDNFDDEPTNRKSVSDIDKNKKNPIEEKVINEVIEKESPPKVQRSNIVMDTKPRIRTPDSHYSSVHQDKPLVRIKDESLLNIPSLDKAENINPDLPMIRIDMDDGSNDIRYVGAIKADDLPAIISEIAGKGKDGKMGKIFAAWEICEQEKDAEDIRKASEERKAKGTSPPPISLPTL